MREEFAGRLLRVYCSERDRWNGKRLDEAILDQCRAMGMAAAVAYRGVEGFGASAAIHRVRHLSRAQDTPVMITIIDREEQIEKLMPALDRMVQEGLVAVSTVEVIRLTHSGS